MKTLETKKAPDPYKDFPFCRGVPYFTPTKAAIQSDIIRINQEVMAKPLEKNKQLVKSPRAM